MIIRGFPASNQDIGFGGLYGVAPALTVATEMAERVEVLKGPGAMLTGMQPNGSVGGAINIVPKRAGDEPLTRFTTSYISDAQFGGHIDVSRRFGSDKQLGIRFNGLYRDGETPVDGAKLRKLGLAVTGVDYRGERVRLSVDLGYQKQRIQRRRWASPTSPPACRCRWAPGGRQQLVPALDLHGLRTDVFGVVQGRGTTSRPTWTIYGAARRPQARGWRACAAASLTDHQFGLQPHRDGALSGRPTPR